MVKDSLNLKSHVPVSFLFNQVFSRVMWKERITFSTEESMHTCHITLATKLSSLYMNRLRSYLVKYVQLFMILFKLRPLAEGG